MYVCMYVRMYVRTYVSMYVRTYVYMCACMHACMQVGRYRYRYRYRYVYYSLCILHRYQVISACFTGTLYLTKCCSSILQIPQKIVFRPAHQLFPTNKIRNRHHYHFTNHYHYSKQKRQHATIIMITSSKIIYSNDKNEYMRKPQPKRISFLSCTLMGTT